MEDSAKEALSMELKNYAEDVNGDGKVQVKILDYSVPDSFDDQQYAQTMDTKLYLEFQAGDAYVFVMPKEKADKLIEDEALNGCLKKPPNGERQSEIINILLRREKTEF